MADVLTTSIRARCTRDGGPRTGLTPVRRSRWLLAGLVAVGLMATACLIQAGSQAFGRGANGLILGGLYSGAVGLAAGMCLARAILISRERLAFAAVGGALSLSCLGNTLFSLSWFVRMPLATAASFTWIAAYVLGFIGLVTLVRSRLGRVSIAGWLDGVVGAFVIEAFIALAFLRPVQIAIEQGNVASAAYLAFPVLDVFLVTLLVAAAAHSRWQLRGWKAIGFGCLLMTVGDGANVANIVHGSLTPVTIANVVSLVPVLFFAYAAWQEPPPAPVTKRPWPLVPAAFGSAALVAVLLASFGHRNDIALGLAGVALTAVILRLALTLSANEVMLETVEEQAATDPLTGLPNRRTLVVDLERSCARATRERPCTLMLFDLDGFKRYNDTFGHPAGDSLLVELGRRLSDAVEGFGVVYRMGGDEFCLLADDPAESPSAVALRAVSALTIACQGLSIAASSGLALIPEEAETASEALRITDQRMYRDKRGQRDGTLPEIAAALLGAFDGRQDYLEPHSAAVANLATMVAEELQLPIEEIERIRLAAMLHDIGKVAVPDTILGKRGPLDDAEWEFMRRHTLIGARMLQTTPVLADIAPLVRSSHERFDGAGYPDGLVGDEIALGARIIFVCDAYDAMASARPYCDAISADAAITELRRCAGSQFDPSVVEAFCRAFAAGRVDQLGRQHRDASEREESVGVKRQEGAARIG
jgi:two-component system cell cycle response regulator